MAVLCGSRLFVVAATATVGWGRLGEGPARQPASVGSWPAGHKEVTQTPSRPHLVTLRRESVPIRRHGKIASFKTSYSGVIAVGGPLHQEFRVVFDTGSGHIVLPSSTCVSPTCAGKTRFRKSTSQTALPVNADGFPLQPDESPDLVTIGYGTGEVTGEFVHDRVCLQQGLESSDASISLSGVCVNVHIVMAVAMSEQPFKSFNFDGIVGLGLEALALSANFSYFDVVARSHEVQSSQFGMFLTEADDGEASELAIGGYNEARLLSPLLWSPVVMADLGYWQVEIVAVRVDGVTMDVCKDGACRGVVDSGTSHLGIPAPFDKVLTEMLTVDAADTLDCRLAVAPALEIELKGINLTLSAETYMRRLPLREGVEVGSPTGVTMTEKEAEETFSMSGERPSENVDMNVSIEADQNRTPSPMVKDGMPTPIPSLQQVRRNCRPRTIAVKLPRPLGPKLFILGEPVLHRYYAVFDWKVPGIGFGLAANRRNQRSPSEVIDRRGQLPDGVDSILMQKKVYVDVDDTAERTDGGSFFAGKPHLHRSSSTPACGLSGLRTITDTLILTQVEFVMKDVVSHHRLR